MFVSALIFIALLAVAIAHFMWAVGASWPIRDKALLAATVIGRPGVTSVPRLASFVVALATLAAGIIGLALSDKASGGVWLTVAGAVLAGVFLGRGVMGYTPQWRARYSAEPFATLDRRNYSPLCLVIGAAFAYLVIMRLL
jgi:hypothetical protein